MSIYANGQVSVVLNGRSLKNELNYNRETWAEWELISGASVVGKSLKIAQKANTSALINVKLKPNTKYGFLVYKENNTLSSLEIFGHAFAKYTGVIPATDTVGWKKRVATTVENILNNSIGFYANVAYNDDTTISSIILYELPTGSEIESDFTNLTADQLAQKYPYINGDSVKSTISFSRFLRTVSFQD